MSMQWRSQKFGMGSSKMFMMFLYSLFSLCLFFSFRTMSRGLVWVGDGEAGSAAGMLSALVFLMSFLVFNMYRYSLSPTGRGEGVRHSQLEVRQSVFLCLRVVFINISRMGVVNLPPSTYATVSMIVNSTMIFNST